MESNTTKPIAPNHHAHHPGFSGPLGVVGALTMVLGRGPVARLAAELADVRAGERVVDLGCGPGAAVREAARRGAAAIGVDPAPVMLRFARWLTLGRRSVTWLRGSAEAVPVGDGCADVVWSIATVHHWSDVGAGLAEVRRVLAPGGRFLAIERRTTPGATGLRSHGWTDAQAAAFADACRASGLEDVACATHRAGRSVLLTIAAGR